MQKIKETILYIVLPVLGAFIITFLVYQSLTDGVKGEVEYLEELVVKKQNTIDSLQTSISKLKEQNLKNKEELKEISDSIQNLRQNINKFKDTTYEKIRSIEFYSNDELESFFTDRYDTIN